MSICRKALKGSPLNMFADRGKDGEKEVGEEEEEATHLFKPLL